MVAHSGFPRLRLLSGNALRPGFGGQPVFASFAASETVIDQTPTRVELMEESGGASMLSNDATCQKGESSGALSCGNDGQILEGRW